MKPTRFLMKHFLLALLLVSGCSFFCLPAFGQQHEGKSISTSKFERLAKKRKAVVIDVRTAGEYNEGHLPEAQMIDFYATDFRENISRLDRNKIYLLYCRSGSRSAQALEIFREEGFKKVFSMKGGIEAWKGSIIKSP